MSDSGAREVRVRIESSSDIVTARQRGRALASLAGFSASDLTIIATAISEVTRNIVEYSGSGEVSISLVTHGGRTGVKIIATDAGPGIADVNLVMRDGYSSANGLGLGLPGARRLMDEFDIVSALGEGTTVTMRKWL
jgi:serine/threonine-protein kinase RsbT